MTHRWTCSLLFLSLLMLLPQTRATAEEPAAKAEGKWETLFDGTNTNSWRNYNKKTLSDGWKVQDGALVRAGEGAGDIVTQDEYGAFELELEFKISPAGNSGVMYHVVEKAGAPPWHSGPEIQIQDNVDGHDPQKCGWLYQLYAAETDATKPAGEWNHLRVVISPEGCKHVLNGVDYVSYKIGSEDWDKKVAASKFGKIEGFGEAGSGHICLQDHGDEVAYRNIRVRRLPGEFPSAK